MLKKFQTTSDTYYFNSDNFTLSTSKKSIKNDKTAYTDKSVLQKVVINISNSCNLSCAYCYADGGNYGVDSKIMDKTTADAIIGDIVSDDIKQINRLILFGGEPFLNINIFTYFIDKLSKFLNIKKVETVTNGTILNSRVKSMIEKYQPFLTVSLDGPQLIHDKLRGKGKHQKTLKFINYLKSINYDKFEIAATYTNVHQKNNIAKSDIFNYLVEMKVKFNINNVFSKNRVLTVKEAEMPMKKRKSFIDQSINDIINDNVNSFISPILYDVLISMIYKSKSLSFCDDINTMNTRTYDVDGSKEACFRFWGKHHSKRVEKFNNKDNFSRCKNCWCKNMCMECVANMIDGYSSIISETGVFLGCQKQELMEYCIYKIIAIAKDENKLFKLVNNFERFIRYA